MDIEDGSIAYKLEQDILENNKLHQYNGVKIIKGGNSELFSKDILPQIETLISL